MSDTPQDKPSEKRTVERVREWKHGGDNRGKPMECDRAEKPHYTDPAKAPKECGGSVPTPWGHWPCENGDWENKGIVHRIKEDGRVIHREGEKADKPQGDGRDGRDKL